MSRGRHRRAGSPAAPEQAKATWWVFVLFALGVFCLYLPSIANGFVDWDDDKNFLNNLAYRGLGVEQLRWMWTTFHLGPYQPLSWMTLGLDYVLWGMKPAGYHATNAALHAVAAGLFGYVAARLADRRGGFAAASFGLLAGVIWAAHPLRVEAVSWITERREVLCGALSLSAVALHLGGRKAAAFAAAIMAMLAKGTAVVLPVVFVLIDVATEAGTRADAWAAAVRRAARRQAPLFAAAVGVGVLAIVGQRYADASATLERIDLGSRAALFGHGIAFYAWKTLWPTGLAPLYEMQVDLGPIWTSGLVGWLLIAAAAVAATRWRERVPALIWLLAAYVVFVAPVGGLLQAGTQVAADRYSYQAGWALSLIAAAAIGALVRHVAGGPGAAPLLVAAAVIAVPLAALSVRQQATWRNAESLWTRQLAVLPETATAHYSLANLRVTRDRTREADLWAEPHFREAIRLQPDRPEAYRGLGNVLRRTDRLDEAIRVYRSGLERAPRHGPLVYGLATALWQRGDRDDAIATLRRLDDCPPVTADTYIVQARALAAAGRAAEAVALYRRAIDAPSDAPAVALMELAWLYATNPDDRVRDGVKAVESSLRAIALDREVAARGGLTLRGGLDARLIKTHAAALAEAGRFEEAATALRQGRDRFPDSQRAEIDAWIAGFTARLPIRETPSFP